MTLYTDHRDELIAVQRQYIDGNTCTIDGTPIREAINKLTELVREERETEHYPRTDQYRQTPLSITSSINP